MKTVSIQIVPFVAKPDTVIHGTPHAVVEVQPNGPTAETTHWAVYERLEDGTARWFADASETNANLIGGYLASSLGVDIEPQPWKSGSQT